MGTKGPCFGPSWTTISRHAYLLLLGTQYYVVQCTGEDNTRDLNVTKDSLSQCELVFVHLRKLRRKTFYGFCIVL